MRFHIGPIPKSNNFEPDDSWNSIKEAPPEKAQWFAAPLGFIAAILVFLIWKNLTPFIIDMPSLLVLIISYIGMIIIHELLHALAHPGSGISSKSILGFWPSQGVFYAHYEGSIRRNRFILILVLPLIVISFIAPFICAVLQISPSWLFFVSILNALAACVDIYGLVLMVTQVPSRAITRNHGWRTYWKFIDS